VDIIDRYLESVRLFLPRAQREDILAELRDVLATRREEQEAELGRPLTRAEDEALLHAFGNPISVAGRYGRPRYLIGPEIFPVYQLVLRIVLASIALAAVITAITVTAVGQGDATHGLLTGLVVVWNGAFTGVGVVTIVFASIERTAAGRHMIDNWRVRDLPRSPSPQRRRRRQQNWIDWVSAVVVHTLFILWWVGVIHFWPTDIPADKTGGLLHFAFAAELRAFYWPVLAFSAGLIGVNVLKLASRETRPIGVMLDFAMQAVAIALAGLALHVGHWVVVTGGAGLPQATVVSAQLGVNIGAQVTLISIIGATLLHLALEAWRRFQAAPEGGAATNGA
jgi:hypothetical protein